MEFNNKEYAVIITLTIFIIWSLVKARDSSLQMLKAFFHKFFIKIYILITLYAFTITYFLYKIGMWKPGFLKTTIPWFLISGMYMAFSSGSNREINLKKTITISFLISIGVDYITGLSCYSLLVEILILWIAIFMSLCIVVIDIKPELSSQKHIMKLKKSFLLMLALIFLNNVFNGINYLIEDKGNSFSLKELVLPFTYTIMFIPFCYILAVYSQYELTFIKIGYHRVKKGYLKLYLFISLLIFFNFNLKKLKKVHNGNFHNALLGSDTFTKINANISDMRNDLL